MDFVKKIIEVGDEFHLDHNGPYMIFIARQPIELAKMPTSDTWKWLIDNNLATPTSGFHIYYDEDKATWVIGEL